MGASALSLLPAGEGAKPCLSGQVCLWFETTIPTETALLCGTVRPRTVQAVRVVPANAVSTGLGSLCQAGVRRTGSGTALSRSIHTPGRDQQPSTARV